MSSSTYVELNGKFRFAINQSGLDYYNKEERQNAVDDFWDEFENFIDLCEKHGFISLDYKRGDVKVREGD